jgi:hypothetical protein
MKQSNSGKGITNMKKPSASAQRVYEGNPGTANGLTYHHADATVGLLLGHLHQADGPFPEIR